MDNKAGLELWNDDIWRAILDFLNYCSMGGPLNILSPTNKLERMTQFVEEYILIEPLLRFRQELGGVFTTSEQVLRIPGFEQELLEQLAYFANQLDVMKLKALAPKTTWNNQVDAYVNGPESLNMMLHEIRRAEKYIHLSVMLFHNDQAGNLIAHALWDALRRGVNVRIMVDIGMTELGYNLKKGVGEGCTGTAA
jgi:cardiolipin synthase